MIAPTPSTLGALYRTFGVRAALYRVQHAWRRRGRRFLSSPSSTLGAAGRPAAGGPFHIDLTAIAAATDRTAALARARRVIDGEHLAFGVEWRARPRTSSAWLAHPLTGHEYPRDIPWFDIAHNDPRAGDIKDVWEPARFGWVIDLVRGYAAGAGEDAAEAFWEGVESFAEAAPPYRGVHWSCGQETTMRAVAMMWGEAAFTHAAATTAARRESLSRLLLLSAERVDDAIGYALSQRNNHAISEAMGLLVLGQRFRDAHPRAAAWRVRGRQLLERLVIEQFTADGWYIQHSFNYLRVALAQLVIAQQVLVSAGESLSDAAIARIRAAVELIGATIQPQTGAMPNHGANDGSDVLPISLLGYGDFRTILTAAAARFGAPIPREVAPSAEALAWLGLPAPSRSQPATGPALRVGRKSGWVALHGEGLSVFARAARYGLTRPSHVDPLQVTVESAHGPIAIDAGTFRYAAAPPWDNALDVVSVHNTVYPADAPIARKLSRFLWVWNPRMRVVSAERDAEGARVTLLHEGWHGRGSAHRRTLVLGDGVLDVIDEVSPGRVPLDATLHWLVAAGAQWPTVTGPGELESVEGSEQSVQGWVSWSYAVREPAVSLAWRARLSPGTTTTWTTRFAAPRINDEPSSGER